jgi:hypothetical protein
VHTSSDEQALLNSCFNTPNEMLPTLLDCCEVIAARFRPKLHRDDFKKIVDADVAASERDATACDALRSLQTALAEVQRASRAPVDIRERLSLYEPSYANVMRTLDSGVTRLANELHDEVLQAWNESGWRPDQVTPERLAFWNPMSLTPHQAIIQRFTMEEGTMPQLEPWMDGPAATPRDLAAISFLAGTMPWAFPAGTSVRQVIRRESSAIGMAIKAVVECPTRRLRLARKVALPR